MEVLTASPESPHQNALDPVKADLADNELGGSFLSIGHA
jgi:hypothetical protein